MKKFIAGAIIAVAIIAIAAPISMGFVIPRVFNADNINAEIAKYGGGAAPFKVRTDSYERSLFGARKVVAIQFLEHETDILVAESDLSFGWYLSDVFPFASLIKSKDRIRFSDEFIAELSKEPDFAAAFSDGVFLEGESIFTPFVSGSGRYASKEIDFSPEPGKLIAVKPLTIHVSTRGVSDLRFLMELPRFAIADSSEFFELTIEEIGLKFDGDARNYAKDASAEFSIKKIEGGIEGGKFNVDNFVIASAQKVRGNLIDSESVISFDAIDVAGATSGLLDAISLRKPRLSLAAIGADAKLTADLQERLNDIQARQAQNPMAVMEVVNLIPDLVAIFDKGAVISVSADGVFNDGSNSFYLSLKTDPQIATPKFSLENQYFNELSGKLIIDANLSVHQATLTALGVAPHQSATLSETGFIRHEGDTWTLDAHFLKNQWTLNGRPAPFQGLAPGSSGATEPDYYEEDFDEEDYDDDEEFDDSEG